MKPVLLSEGFEAPGYENEGWIETIDEGCIITPDFAADSPDKGDYILKAESVDVYSPKAKTTYELDGVINQFKSDITAYIKLKDHSLTLSKQIQPLVLTTAAGSKVAKITFCDNNYVLSIRFDCLNGYGGWFYGTPIPINVDQWYLVRFIYDIDKKRYKFKLDNRTREKGDLGDTNPLSIRKLDTGICYNNGNGPATVYVASVEWDD